MKTIFLYVKTHNETGLKYFGKTVNKDVHSYHGSGTRWINHIKKHGYNVTTEVIGAFTDHIECKRVAIEFSIQNDIVASPQWANLKVECLDGGWDHITVDHIKKGIDKFRQRPLEEQKECNAKKAQHKEANFWFGRDRSGKNNPRFGVTISEEQKQKQREKMTGTVKGVLQSGEIIHTHCDDQRFLTGELVYMHKNKAVYKDENGKTFYVKTTDVRVVTGELKSINLGKNRTEEEKQHLSNVVSLLKWYNNGVVSVRRKEHPGIEWKVGRLKK